MAVDVSKIPNNNKFDPVREAILDLQSSIEDTGAAIGNGTLTIGTSGSLSGSGTFTANQTSNTTITIGIDDSDYLSLSDTGEQTIAGDIVISGDLTISGTTTFIDTTNLNIGDNIITLNADLPSGTAPTENAGIEINRGSSANKTFIWNETSDKWTLGSETLVAGTFEGNLTGDVTGNADTATNADQVDGKHAEQFTLDYVTGNPSGNTTDNKITLGGGLHVNTLTNTKPLEISRIGGTTTQLVNIGITDTTTDFKYIEDTTSEGNGNFGSYRFILGGNDGETDIVALQIYKDNLDLAGSIDIGGSVDVGGSTVITSGRALDVTSATVKGVLNLTTAGASLEVGGTEVIDASRNITANSLNTDSISGGTINIDASTRLNLQHNGSTKAYVDSSGFNIIDAELDLSSVAGISLTDSSSSTDSYFHANVDYDGGLYTVTSNVRYGSDYIQVDGLDSRDSVKFTISPKDIGDPDPHAYLYIGGDNSLTSPNTLVDWHTIEMNALSVQINNNEVATQTWVTNTALGAFDLQDVTDNGATTTNDISTGSITVNGSVGVTNIVTNKIVKFNGTILDDSIITDDGTNVGIGTTSPDLKFHVSANGAVSKFESTSTGMYNQYSNSTGTLGYIGSGNGIASGGSTTDFGIRAQSNLIFTSGGSTERMRVNTNGNVGIGTTSPSAKLHISGNSITGGTAYIQNGMGTAGSFNASQLVLDTTNAVNTTGWQGISFDTSTAAGYGWSIGANRSSSGRGSFRFYEHINNDTGIERFTIAEGGNVGIGTTTPGVKLEVKDGSSGEFTALHLTNTFDDNNASSNPLVSMWLNAASNNGYLRLYGAPADTASKHRFDIGSTAGSSFITFSTSADEKMRIANDGKIGIGTDTPSNKLHVKSGDNEGIFMEGTGGGHWFNFKSGTSNLWSMGAQTGLMGWYNRTDSTYKMVITDGGSVGIGTTSPARKLHVQGTGYFTGDVNQTLLLGRISGAPTISADASNGGYLIMDSTSNVCALNWYTAHNVVIAQGGGNVLIGSPYVAPNARLHVRDNNAGGIVARFQNDSNGAESALRFQAYTTGGSARYADIALVPDTQTLTIRSPYNSVGGFDVEDGGDVRIRTASGYINIGALNTAWAHFYTDRGGYYFNEKVIVDSGTIGSYNEDLLLVRSDTQSDYIRIASTYIGFYLDGNQDMTLNNGGQLGIGTTAPNGKITLKGSGQSWSTAPIIKMWDDYNNKGWLVGSANNQLPGDFYIRTLPGETTNPTSSQQEFTIQHSTGFVGIGTTSPQGKLDVRAGSGGKIILGSYDANYNVTVQGGNQIDFYNGASATNGYINYLGSGTGLSQNLFVEKGSAGTTGNVRITASGSLGIGTTSPQAKLDVKGGILTRNTRVNDSQAHPVGHYNSGEEVFGIDPTWSQSELQQFFNSSNVTWNADSTAPGGYAIYINGGVNVGGVYSSGFPYIPVDQDDYFYMEVWIKNAGSGQTHYMGSNEFNQNFTSLGGHPGSFGYWVMSNTNPGSSWTKVSGYIGGFSASTIGTFENGTKYWTPMALFNYGAGSGTRACYISGWKVYRVTQQGRRKFTGAVGVLGGSYSAGIESVSDAGLVVKQGRKIYSLANSDQYLRNLIEHNTANHIVIGQTGTSLIADVEIKTGSSGNFKVFTNGGETMRVDSAAKLHVENDIIAFSTTVSDARLKDEVVTIDNALDKVKALRGVEYVWNKGGREGQKDLGFIAQEVEQVIPEIVRENEMPLMDDSGETYKTVDYEKVVAVLVEAIKEQQKQIDELKARLDGSTK